VPRPESSTVGILLAAGEGRRMGRPKALMHDADGTSWLLRSCAALDLGGCSRITVVLGAGAEEARSLLEDVPVDVIVAPDWASGMSASLRAGLGFLVDGDAALLHLVDLPDVGPEVVSRVLAAGVDRDVLSRAAYAGRPGHPVLIGRHHWPGVLGTARGDQGARGYLETRPVGLVECGDLATGRDVDHPSVTAGDL
jgi:molybdenum cofactor cytidylyltransferase/nicotine blue oxidoreductase